MARVTLALARDFEAQSGATAVRDPTVLGRLAEAYLRASLELRSVEQTEISLPFLAATSEGPKHYLRVVTVADLSALARSEPPKAAAPPPAASPLPQEPPPAGGARKWWWPF